MQLPSFERGSIAREAASWLLLLAVLSPVLLYAVPGAVGAEDALVVLSGSMEPEIQTGSVAYIYPVNPSSLERGDVITYRSGEDPATGQPQLTTHRIIEVVSDEPPQFRTKGDNNEDPDPSTVSGDEVVGRYVFSVPFLGYLLSWAGTTQAFVVLVVLPASVLIVNELLNILSELGGFELETPEIEGYQSAIAGVSAVSLVGAAVFLTDLGSLVFSSSSGVSVGPTGFGVLMVVAMLLSMIGLKFSDL
jgi:signal peptidase